MRATVLLLAAAALAAIAPPAGAGPVTTHFETLLVELNARDADAPTDGKQRTALKKCFAALKVASKDLAGDVAMARKMAKALETGYPEDAVFAGLLDLLGDNLGEEARGVRDDLVVAVLFADEGKLRDKAQAKLDEASLLQDQADVEAVASTRFRILQKEMAALKKGKKLADKATPGGSSGSSAMGAILDGTPWQANSAFGTAVTGGVEVSSGASGVRKIVVTGRRILPNTADKRLPGVTTRLQITLTATGIAIEPGTYSVGFDDEVSASASWTTEPESGPLDYQLASEGTVTLTSMTVQLGSVAVEGTFHFTLIGGAGSIPVAVTDGSFRAADLPRTTVP